MKFIIALFALLAVAAAAPAQEHPAVPFDVPANVGVVGKVQSSSNTVGDIVTLGINAQAEVNADINQTIVNVILGLINNQNGNSLDVGKFQSLLSMLSDVKKN